MRRTVDAKEINKVDCIELWALKTMFGLPPLTSTAAVRYVTGTLFTDVWIEMRQILYLHTLLNKEDGHWAKEALKILRKNDTEWIKNMEKTLKIRD